VSSQFDRSLRAARVPDAEDALRLIENVPLFAGLPAHELEDLVRLMQPIERPAGAPLWRQGQTADGLHVIVEGKIAISLRQPGGAEVRVAALGPRDVLGEVPLLDGGTRSANARMESAARLLFLSRADFEALTLRRHPTALTVRRRILLLVCQRLRSAYGELAATLGEELGGGPRSSPPASRELTSAPPPADYLRRLAFFSGFGASELTELLDRSQVGLVPRGRVLAAEGDPAQALYVTLNGAVEEAIERARQRIPVGLAGPGLAFSYVGLIDGNPSALTAKARERSLVLVVPRPAFQEYFHGTNPTSYAVLGGVERDLIAALRRKDVGFVRAIRATRALS
jgi:CRP-like cAMP-binding protein